MYKKMIALFVTLLTALSLAACGAGQKRDEDALTLLIKRSDIEKSYIQKILKQYESETGGKIQPIIVENVDFDQKVTEIFAGEDLPDLFFHYNDSQLSFLDVPKHFYYLNGQEWAGELTNDVFASCLDSEGNVLGLPFWENSLSGCYYNKKILDKLGLRPATTQAEFDALCAALKAAGQTPLYWASNACNWMFQFGLDPIFADDPKLLEQLNQNKIAYADIPAVLRMAEWLDAANKKGWFHPGYAGASWDDIAPAMANGEAVFLFSWDTWFDTDLSLAKGTYTPADFAVMPIFLNTAETGTYEGGNMNMLMVTKTSPRLEQALAFLRFCATPKNYNVAFEGISTVNCFRNQTTNIQSPMVTDAAVSIEKNLRVSTARPKITGYQQNDVGAAVLKLFQGEVDPVGCVALMDEYRRAAAREMGAAGF